MSENPFPFKGLDNEHVLLSRKKHGANTSKLGTENTVWKAIKGVVFEPMFLLLIISAGVYHLLGELTEAIYMLCAIILVSAISFFQDTRSRNALSALKTLSAPRAKVIRNGNVSEILSSEVVVGDYLIAEEGTVVAADGVIIQENDFSVNQSMLTGESFPVNKSVNSDNKVYQGTLVTSGLAVYTVTKIGNQTELGKIGTSISSIKEEVTPLQKQINKFVTQMAIAGGIIFIIIWTVSYFKTGSFLDSLLKALTLAMSILPEEIPVAFTTFMALGAWRLMKKGVIVKQTQTVEALGAATVICTDKTGTITENKMQLAKIYLPVKQLVLGQDQWKQSSETFGVIYYSVCASEPVPFDPMEIAIHEEYKKLSARDERSGFKMVHEYPLSGKPPLMTHIFEDNHGKRIIAAKGAPEGILNMVNLTPLEKFHAEEALRSLAKDGYRVLAVASSEYTGFEFPEDQHSFPFQFEGLIAFYDPPKQNINKVFHAFYDAGIAVKIITGDNALTTSAIARKAGFKGAEFAFEGEQLLKMNEAELEKQVEKANVFTRMFPEAKLRIINALKRKNNIVAMTGDGVNDGPALKAAHIGIAMGKRGSELAREASSLILLDDDLGKMVDAVAMGRRIYFNLKKAVQYIVSIHIPIILTVTLPLLLNWIYPIIFTPVHVIFLELIMGPTCSIIYENEPMESDAMKRPPRRITQTFLSWKEISMSVWQGLIITAGTLLVYQMAVTEGNEEKVVRTMVFTTLFTANIILTLVNRSFTFSVFSSFKYKNNLLRGMILASLLLLVLMLKIPAIQGFFGFTDLNYSQVLTAILIGVVSVIWFEFYKYFKNGNIYWNLGGLKGTSS